MHPLGTILIVPAPRLYILPDTPASPFGNFEIFSEIFTRTYEYLQFWIHSLYYEPERSRRLSLFKFIRHKSHFCNFWEKSVSEIFKAQILLVGSFPVCRFCRALEILGFQIGGGGGWLQYCGQRQFRLKSFRREVFQTAPKAPCYKILKIF